MAERLKIGLVLDDSLDRPDGVQQFVLALGGWLRKNGHEVKYLVGQTTGKFDAPVYSLSRNISARFNGNRMSFPLPVKNQIIRELLAAERFDIIHVQMPFSPWLAGRVIKVSPPTTAIVGTFHIAPKSGLAVAGAKVLGMYERRVLRRFDKVTSVSKTAHDFCDNSLRLGSTIIPNAVDLHPFAGAKPFGKYNDGKINIVFVGRLVERKGAMNLLAAITELKCRVDMDNIRVLIVGKGPQLSKLESFVRLKKLEDIVEFAGFVSEGAKPSYLAAADIAVFPSTGGESFGIVLIEAMAAARGVVLAGDNPGYADVVSNRSQLIDPMDKEQFAKKLKAYIEKPDGRSSAAADQKKYVSRFDIASVGPQIVKVYTEALKKASKMR